MLGRHTAEVNRQVGSARRNARPGRWPACTQVALTEPTQASACSTDSEEARRSAPGLHRWPRRASPASPRNDRRNILRIAPATPRFLRGAVREAIIRCAFRACAPRFARFSFRTVSTSRSRHAPVIVPGDFIGGAGRDPHWEPSVSRSVGTSFAASSMCRSRSACASRDYAPKATPTSFDIRSRRASMPVRRSSPTAS